MIYQKMINESEREMKKKNDKTKGLEILLVGGGRSQIYQDSNKGLEPESRFMNEIPRIT